MTTQTKAADPVREAMTDYGRACYDTGYAQARADLLVEMQPVAWVAADTLNSPHPRCVSSLAYVSQLDRERGREYVALAIIPKE